MNTVATKKITSLRLNSDLYSYIERLAKGQNRSVNNFIETTLVDATDFERPNAETLEAMKEVREHGDSLKRYNSVKSLLEGLEKE